MKTKKNQAKKWYALIIFVSLLALAKIIINAGSALTDLQEIVFLLTIFSSLILAKLEEMS